MIILNYITAITIVIAVLITINFIAYMIVDREYLNSSEARNMMKSTMYIRGIYLCGISFKFYDYRHKINLNNGGLV